MITHEDKIQIYAYIKCTYLPSEIEKANEIKSIYNKEIYNKYWECFLNLKGENNNIELFKENYSEEELNKIKLMKESLDFIEKTKQQFKQDEELNEQKLKKGKRFCVYSFPSLYGSPIYAKNIIQMIIIAKKQEFKGYTVEVRDYKNNKYYPYGSWTKIIF